MKYNVSKEALRLKYSIYVDPQFAIHGIWWLWLKEFEFTHPTREGPWGLGPNLFNAGGLNHLGLATFDDANWSDGTPYIECDFWPRKQCQMIMIKLYIQYEFVSNIKRYCKFSLQLHSSLHICTQEYLLQKYWNIICAVLKVCVQTLDLLESLL